MTNFELHRTHFATSDLVCNLCATCIVWACFIYNQLHISTPNCAQIHALENFKNYELQPILSCTICIPQISKSSLELACNLCLQKGASTFYLKWHKTCRNLQLAQHTYCATTHTLKKVAKYWFCNSGFQDPSSGSWNYWESLDESFAPFWPQEGDCF